MELTQTLTEYYTEEHLSYCLSNGLIRLDEYKFIKSLEDVDKFNHADRKKALERFKNLEERLSKALSSKFDKDTRSIASYRKSNAVLF